MFFVILVQHFVIMCVEKYDRLKLTYLLNYCIDFATKMFAGRARSVLSVIACSQAECVIKNEITLFTLDMISTRYSYFMRHVLLLLVGSFFEGMPRNHFFRKENYRTRQLNFYP